MSGYCKHCHRDHSAWARFNDGAICGLCGARSRDLRVVPVDTMIHHASGKKATIEARVARTTS